VMARCDAADGVKDGMLTVPRKCDWDASELICKPGQDASQCITAEQAEGLNEAYAPVRNPRTGETIYSGLTRGSEAAWIGRIGSMKGPGPNPFGEALFKWTVFDDANWNWLTFDYDRDMALADKLDAETGQINTIDPDLSAYRKKGGKLIQWHGWLDEAMTPEWYTQYYESVVDKLHPDTDRETALKQTQNFYRLFMSPGSTHCIGGPGPNTFGSVGHRQIPPFAPTHDLLSALERWVEQGVAPDQVIATKYVNDDPKQGVVMERPLCPHPQVARYKGSGDTNQAASFACIGN